MSLSRKVCVRELFRGGESLICPVEGDLGGVLLSPVVDDVAGEVERGRTMKRRYGDVGRGHAEGISPSNIRDATSGVSGQVLVSCNRRQGRVHETERQT